MTNALFTLTTIDVAAGQYLLSTKGRVTKFDGYLAASPNIKKNDEDKELPNLKVQDNLELLALIPSQHFTKPVARYSEASLGKGVGEKGIGRPSTYASIISTIQDRGYVRIENKRIFAEKIGDIVTDRLSECFGDLMNYSFTATMEKRLMRLPEALLIGKHYSINSILDLVQTCSLRNQLNLE